MSTTLTLDELSADASALLLALHDFLRNQSNLPACEQHTRDNYLALLDVLIGRLPEMVALMVEQGTLASSRDLPHHLRRCYMSLQALSEPLAPDGHFPIEEMLCSILEDRQERLGWDDPQFAHGLGISPSLWGKIRREERAVGLSLLRGIAKAYPDLNDKVLSFLQET